MNNVKFIKNIISEIYDCLDGHGLEGETNYSEDQDSGFALFIKGPYGYIPYTIRFDFTFSDNKIELNYYWAVSRMMFSGIKSDSYVLWASLMSLVLKSVFGENVEVVLEDHVFLDCEIGGAVLLFPKGILLYDNGYEKGQMTALLFKFIFAQSIIAEFFGSVSNVLKEKITPDYYFKNNYSSCYLEREDYIFEWDGKNSFRFNINNGVC